MAAAQKIGLIDEIRIKAANLDPKIAESYLAGLRDASEFWRLWHMFPDDPALAQLKEEQRQKFRDILYG